MKKSFVLISGCLLMLALPSSVYASPLTVDATGTAMGRSFSSVTIDHDTNMVQFNFDDGGSFTNFLDDANFLSMLNWLNSEQRHEVNMD